MTRQLHLQHQQTTTTICNHQMANKLIKQNKLNKMNHLHPVSSKRRRRHAEDKRTAMSWSLLQIGEILDVFNQQGIFSQY